MFHDFKTWLCLSNDPGIIIAQYDAMRRQMPMLFALLIINAAAVTYIHYLWAPQWLTVGITACLISIVAVRLLAWTVFAEATAKIAPERARKLLQRSIVSATAFSLAFLTWAMLLDQYGGQLEHAHIAVFTAITVIGCTFCLMHLPQAALLVNVTIMVPLLIYYLCRGNPIFIAIGFNIALVSAVMTRVLLNTYAAFTTQILSQASLALQQVATERLGEDNARLALIDMLTGLPNRRYFFSRLDEMLQECAVTGERFAVGIFDLDRFKPVNDMYGHVMGDRLLADVGRRLAGQAGEGIMIARLGGDEFGALISTYGDRAFATGQHICALLSEPFDIDDNRLSLGCSGGIAIYPDAGTDANELIDRADYALYNVKSAHRGGCALFSADHETRIRSERAMEAALQTADLDAELHVEFQPIMCLSTLTILGVEALGRWTSPLIGEVPPDRFIAVAERVGMMHPITIKLFRKALRSFVAMPRNIGLSFNLSAQDIVSSELIALLMAAIEEEGVDPSRVTFELTETALMCDFDAAVSGIRRLRSIGIAIALDDFGTGYSSLSSLNRLPLDEVKIDRSFVDGLGEKAGRNIVGAILGLCRTLEIDCIIEGIETELQHSQANELGFDLAQGYLFATPMTMPSLLLWLEERGWQEGFSFPRPRHMLTNRGRSIARIRPV